MMSGTEKYTHGSAIYDREVDGSSVEMAQCVFFQTIPIHSIFGTVKPFVARQRYKVVRSSVTPSENSALRPLKYRRSYESSGPREPWSETPGDHCSPKPVTSRNRHIHYLNEWRRATLQVSLTLRLSAIFQPPQWMPITTTSNLPLSCVR